MAQIQDSTGRRSALEVEPFTNYFVARLSHDLPGGNYVRGMVTSVVRDIRDTTLRGQLNTHSETAGLETDLWWAKRTYHLMANAAASQVDGSPADILRVEQSSARYFQRPDRRNGANSLFSDAYDTTLTALRGYGFYTRFAKDAGNWMWELAANVRSPGFEANDVAFNSQADRIAMMGNLVWQFTKPNRFARAGWFDVGGQQSYNYSHDLVDRQVQAYAQLTFHNYWMVSGFYINRPARLSDNLARGGPVLGVPALDFFQAQLMTDSRRALSFTASPDYYCSDAQCSYDLSFDATIHPTSNLSLDLGPSWSDNLSRTQYVTTVADPTATATYGSRYVFADLRERTLAMNARVDWTFTPALTLQVYVQPLIASGAYSAFKEYNAPRTLARSVYGVDRGTIAYANGTYTVDPDGAGPAAPFSFGDPNFTFRSLRGSAVLRWEYLPGSTVYFVWTQTRSAVDPFGNLVPSRDIKGLVGPAPENIFLVKFSYWLGL